MPMPQCLIECSDNVVSIHSVREDAYADWLDNQDAPVKSWLKASGFEGEGGQAALLPGLDGDLAGVVYVVGGSDGRGGPWDWGALRGQLPDGDYCIDDELSADDAYNAALGFALSSYEFDRYQSQDDRAKSANTDDDDAARRGAYLVWPAGCPRDKVRAAHGATQLVRDLINTPASDLGPAELAAATKELAEASGAQYSEIVGVDLIRKDYPAVYAVGRGAEESRAPRLIEFTWGREGAPRVALVGKGVTFDTGGLNLKTGNYMKLMKKDMGGAAHALGLASMVMAMDLDVRLHVVIAAVENSLSAGAMRPSDVIATRKGLSVEIGNTDAEGRVILADALAHACEDMPDVVVDFATLTGAARVALGTELPALMCNDNVLAEDILQGGTAAFDPLWPLPLHAPYKKMIKSKIADIRNDTDSAYAGAITAGLFLEAFVREGVAWAHVDLMGWNVSASPARPEGGEAMSMRAIFEALSKRFGG